MRTGEGTLNDAEKLAEHLEGAPEAVLARLRGEFAETYSLPGSDAVKYVCRRLRQASERALTLPQLLGKPHMLRPLQVPADAQGQGPRGLVHPGPVPVGRGRLCSGAVPPGRRPPRDQDQVRSGPTFSLSRKG